MLIAGSPAKLPGTVNTSFTYVSTGFIDATEDRAEAGPTVVGHKMMSHFVSFAEGDCRDS